MGLAAPPVRWRTERLHLVSPAGREAGPVEGLVFDLGGTLDADGVGWAERFRRHWRERGVEVDAAALEAGERAVLDHPRAAALDLAAMVTLHVEAQRRALGQGAAVAAALAERFGAETLEALRGRAGLLARLAERMPLAVVSNGCGNTRVLLAEAGLEGCFRAVVDSAEVGVWKPDPGILKPALQALGRPAERVAVVGDRVDRDADAARAAGALAVWVTGRPEPPADDPRLAGVDAAVADVGALDPEPR